MNSGLSGSLRESGTARYNRSATDTFGDSLRRIGRSPLLTAEQDVDLARRIEVGLFAGARLTRGVREHTILRELTWLAHDGGRAKNHFIEASLHRVVSIARFSLPYTQIRQEVE